MVDKVTFAPVSTFTNDTTAVTQTNANYVLMQNAIDNTVSRDGTTPNQMGANLDMNQNRILNLASPGSANEPLRLADITLVPPAGAVFASPTATVGLAAVNGVATTIMRSDAAPPLSQSINPTWTGTHTFNNIPTLAGAAAVNLSATQTLTNKTLTSPVIGTIVNTGTLTLPTSSDTLVGRATTDTLTNKTLTSPVINTPNFGSNTISTTGTITAGTDVQATGYFKSGGFSRLSSNFNQTSQTTLQNSPISVNLTSGVTYIFEGRMLFPASGSQNVKLGLGGTATATSINCAVPAWHSASGFLIPGVPTMQTSLPATILNNNGASATDSGATFGGVITCSTSGTFLIQFAQNTSSATTSTLGAGSYMMVYQVT